MDRCDDEGTGGGPIKVVVVPAPVDPRCERGEAAGGGATLRPGVRLDGGGKDLDDERVPSCEVPLRMGVAWAGE